MLVIFILFLCAVALFMSWQSRMKKKISEQNDEIRELREENHMLHEEKKFVTCPLPPPLPPNGSDAEIQRLRKVLSEKDNEIKRISSLENEYFNEIQRLNKRLYEKETEIDTLNIKREKLKQLLYEQDQVIERLKKELEGKKSKQGKIFVSVKFYKNAPDTFDYFIGKIKGLKIGDRVMVPAKGALKPATICYISKPGEFSEYARLEIVSKIDEKPLLNLFD